MFKRIGVLLFILFLSGCGAAGETGKAFIALDWVYKPQYFAGDNNALVGSIEKGKFYRTQPGKYYFEYIAFEGSGYYGTYTITVKKGEGGGFLTPGKDGRDSRFTLTLLSTGPTFTVKAVDIDNETNRSYMSLNDDSNVLDGQETQFPAQHVGETITEQTEQDDYVVTLEYQLR